MEVANWNGPNINRTSTRLGLRSEASARFEKGLAPEQAMEAQAVATRLMIELCGARLVEGTVDVGGVPEPSAAASTCATRAWTRLLGVDVPRERSAEVLGALGFGVGGRRRRARRRGAALAPATTSPARPTSSRRSRGSRRSSACRRRSPRTAPAGRAG